MGIISKFRKKKEATKAANKNISDMTTEEIQEKIQAQKGQPINSHGEQPVYSQSVKKPIKDMNDIFMKPKGNGHKPQTPPPPKQTSGAIPSDDQLKASLKNSIDVDQLPADLQEMIMTKAREIAAGMVDNTTAEREEEAREDLRAKRSQIPGYGWMFGIDKEHLPEMSVLHPGQEVIIASGNMQENMLDPKRDYALWDRWIEDIMRLSISAAPSGTIPGIGGLGREQAILARQQDADRNATNNFESGMQGKPIR
jgi:hypothetical protein